VRQWPQECFLHSTAEVPHFGISKVSFNVIVICPIGIGMELNHISMNKDWPIMEFIWDMEVLLGFTNFYQLFIRKYAKLTTPISGLLKTAETSRMPKQNKWEWTRDVEVAFWKLNRDFTDAPIHRNFDLGQLNCLPTDHSGIAIADILNK